MNRTSLSLFTSGAAAVMLSLLLIGCSPKITMTATSHTTDSVRVEYRERLVHDTTYVEIPREVERNVTRDTLSRLENTYARSEARVSDGQLYHTLETKPQRLAVPVDVAVRDTYTSEKSSSETDTVEIKEVERQITKFEKFQRDCFWVFAGLALAGLVYAAWRLWRCIKK